MVNYDDDSLVVTGEPKGKYLKWILLIIMKTLLLLVVCIHEVETIIFLSFKTFTTLRLSVINNEINIYVKK